MMCKCWNTEPCDRPTFSELRSHFEGAVEGQHASYYVDFTASLAPTPDEERGEEHGKEIMAVEGTSHIFARATVNELIL